MEMKKRNAFNAALNLGISHSEVLCLLALVEAPKEVKKLIEEKKIDPSYL
jgi:DNA-binding MarR family transcriptional regulator